MRFAKELTASAPAEAEAFFKLKSVTELEGGAIPAKYRELIALCCADEAVCVLPRFAYTECAEGWIDSRRDC
jgi:hypothetical protein